MQRWRSANEVLARDEDEGYLEAVEARHQAARRARAAEAAARLARDTATKPAETPVAAPAPSEQPAAGPPPAERTSRRRAAPWIELGA